MRGVTSWMEGSGSWNDQPAEIQNTTRTQHCTIELPDINKNTSHMSVAQQILIKAHIDLVALAYCTDCPAPSQMKP